MLLNSGLKYHTKHLLWDLNKAATPWKYPHNHLSLLSITVPASLTTRKPEKHHVFGSAFQRNRISLNLSPASNSFSIMKDPRKTMQELVLVLSTKLVRRFRLVRVFGLSSLEGWTLIWNSTCFLQEPRCSQKVPERKVSSTRTDSAHQSYSHPHCLPGAWKAWGTRRYVKIASLDQRETQNGDHWDKGKLWCPAWGRQENPAKLVSCQESETPN